MSVNRFEPFVLAAILCVSACSSSSDSTATSDSSPSPQSASTDELQASHEPTPVPRASVESDAALVARLEAKANDALATYVALHDDAVGFVADAPVSGTSMEMTLYTSEHVSTWFDQERTFQASLDRNMPTVVDLRNRSGAKADRARALIIGVFANLGVADNLLFNGVTDLTATCNAEAARLQLRAADEAAHTARLTLDGKLTMDSEAIVTGEPDYIVNLDESNKCNDDSSGGG